MRAFLALTVTASMFLLGYIKREKMKKHERLMREIQLFIKLMKPRTQYLHEPFYKTVEVLSECESLSELIFLKTCTEKRERGEDFPKAWSESLQSFGLGKQDRELLLSFGNAVFSANSTDIIILISAKGQNRNAECLLQ